MSLLLSLIVLSHSAIVRMAPLFIVMPLVGEIVKTASMLSAIAELEIDIMGASPPPSLSPSMVA